MRGSQREDSLSFLLEEAPEKLPLSWVNRNCKIRVIRINFGNPLSSSNRFVQMHHSKIDVTHTLKYIERVDEAHQHFQCMDSFHFEVLCLNKLV